MSHYQRPLVLASREVPLGPSHLPVATFTYDPVQARAMDKADIADLRRWHRTTALRSKTAGFDIVYVYAGHGLSVFEFFLPRRHNSRGDEYGGRRTTESSDHPFPHARHKI